MDREYDEYYSVEQRRRRERIRQRINTWGLLLLFVALMSWTAIELCPRLWLAFEVWKMGN